MLRGMYSAISGLKMHQSMLDVTANDIANVNTIGYKGSRTTFTDQLAQLQSAATAPQNGGLGGRNPGQIGLGVQFGSIDNLMGGGAPYKDMWARSTTINVVNEMIRRDRSRFEDARRRMNESPLGAAALAGTSYPLDREETARELGFDGVTANSPAARRFAMSVWPLRSDGLFAAMLRDLARAYPESNRGVLGEVRPFWRAPRGPQEMMAGALEMLGCHVTIAHDGPAALAAVVLTAAATAGVSALGGTVAADGSSTVGPYAIAAAEGFQKKNRGARVTVGISGTGGGFERFCRGEIDLANASRPMKQSEAVVCRDNGVKWVAFTVANDALTVVVNRENTWATCLTVAELEKMIGTEQGPGGVVAA